MAEEVIFPLNQSGDQEGCTRHDDGSVTTPKGFKEAFEQYKEGGWMGLAFDPEYGGQGLPYALHSAVGEYFSSANMAFAMYPGLTQGAMAAIHVHGSDEQKQKYLPKMVEGTWTGTMNLTEPHCGTDLGLLRTKAVPQGDGSYKISGQKIFISAGEHDMSDNIIHLVLARIEGAPEGVKGISLFIVPKFMVGEDGSLGERNGVTCGSLEEKMGIHGNATCVMNYDEATGYLIGEENKGLKAMFTMMNEARLGVGLQGLSISEVAYQNAVAYAKDRLQGRSLTGPKEPDKKADPIIVHPGRPPEPDDDPRLQRGRPRLHAVGGAEIRRRAPSEDETDREQSEEMMGLVTPVIKGVLTDKGFDHAVMAQQMYRRPRLYRGMGHEPVCARCAHRHDLRGRQRHPGARPRRPQAAGQWRPRRAGLLQGSRRVLRGKPRQRGADLLHQAPEEGSQRPAVGDHVVRAERDGEARQCRCRLLPTTCTSSGLSRSATCGRCRPRPRVEKRAPVRTATRVPGSQAATARYFMERIMPETSLRIWRASKPARTR
jgi:alkylation response protein AidB-like acyl-CoA dehydrogenase